MEEDITKPPTDPTELTTTKQAVKQALASAGITREQVGTAEIHDCFTIAGLMCMEAIGFAEKGKGADYILEGNTSRTGRVPINTTGGLIGWGHPTGGTGVHQAVTILEQLTGKAGDAQVEIPADRPYGLTVNMGGDDKSLVSIVYKQGK
jgi:acetyl-CoA C-acetyltransferase/acetyl-CoA acyltransferase